MHIWRRDISFGIVTRLRGWQTKNLGFAFRPVCGYHNNSYLLKFSYVGFLLIYIETLQFLLKSNTKITDILNEDLRSFMISVSGCSL